MSNLTSANEEANTDYSKMTIEQLVSRAIWITKAQVTTLTGTVLRARYEQELDAILAEAKKRDEDHDNEAHS